MDLALLLVAAVVGSGILLLGAFLWIVRPRPVKIVPKRRRHVFVTGGSTGIGLGAARRAAMDGSRVSILAPELSKLEAARVEIRRAADVEVAIYCAEIGDERAVAEAMAASGTIDLLIQGLE